MSDKIYLLFLAFLGTSTGQTTNSSLPSSTSKSTNETTTLPPEKRCFTEDNRRVRTFATLQDYQGNEQSFDPQNPTYQGNLVNFNFTTIYTLSDNDFVSFGSNSIMEIDLHRKEISSIKSGAFKALFCLSKLDLSYNRLKNLTEGSFEGLENLKELDLSHNQLMDIPDTGMAFLTLKGLVKLDLSFNEIKSINKLSFMMLYKLELLNLGHNKIKTIDDRVFNYFIVLKELRLNDNLLVETFADRWINLENLTILDLSNNQLTSFDTSANYTFSNLEKLNLSGNHLQFLNVYWIGKNFHKLKSLDLADNLWYCDDFKAIKHSLTDLRIAIPRAITCRSFNNANSESSTTKPSNSLPNSNNQNQNYGARFLEQTNRILNTNKEIADYVDSLKSTIVFLFLLLVLGIAVDVGIRIGVFRNCCASARRNYRGYLDSNEVESVGLISR